MATPTIESLEARFEELQRKVLGEGQTVGAYERRYADKTHRPQSVVELLANTSSLMCTALSGREKVHAMVSRAAELETYLDPTYEEGADTAALAEALLSLEPMFARQLRQLEALAKLAPVLDSTDIAEVPECRRRLEPLLASGLELYGLSDESCARVYALIDEYNSIIVGITKTLVQWEDIVTQAEMERKPKKVAD